jgi:mycofactocin glycosyltransferase
LGKAVSVHPRAVIRTADLPPSTRLVPETTLQVLPGRTGGHVLLGGSPYTLLTLRPKATEVVSLLLAGQSLGEVAHNAAVSVDAVTNVARRLLNAGMVEPKYAGPHTYSIADVTAVIPAHNESATIGELVRALRSSGVSQVVVVDDGSIDGTGLAAQEGGAQVLRNEVPMGPAAARNRGFHNVTGSLVLFIDADTVTDPCVDWAELLIAFDDPSVAFAAPRIASQPGTSGVHRYEILRSPLDLGPRRGSVRPRSRVAYVPSAALLVRVDAFNELGGFDQALRYGEDVDLVWRAVNANFVVRYEADIVIHHRPRTSVAAFVNQRRRYGSSAAALEKRHPGFVAPLHASGWSVIVWALGLFGGPFGLLTSAVTALGTAGALEPKLKSLAQPRRIAWSLTLKGHLGVGRQLASVTWRAWLPFALLAAIVSRRSRIALALSTLFSLEEWFVKRPNIDPIRFVGFRLLDDASYCSGVWQGCIAQRSFRALMPHLSNWPGKPDESKKD